MKTYFISGHRNITPEDFNRLYIPAIQRAASDHSSRFVVGDYYGVDIMAQNYLAENGLADRVTVYHMFESPRNKNPEITKTIGGFKTDIERDSEMTKISDEDIAFIYPGRWTSGTAQNILRRYELL